MNKTVPTVGRLAVMVVFALSCFGLLLFLWTAFGGSFPLKPKGYRFQAAFPEATQLAQEADVRIAGVQVGKVRVVERDPRGGRTLATIEMDRRYAPVPVDARAMLRQKTLLGETYIEMTPGNPDGPKVPEGGRLANTQVKRTVEFDEILSALDPETRKAFQVWQQDQGKGVDERGLELSDAIGELPGLAEEGADTLEILRRERAALKRLVQDTGTVFAALTEREDKLRELIVNSREVFDETSLRADRLAEAIEIFPTFLDESKRTFERAERFSRDAHPVVRLLRRPVRDLGPTFADLEKLAPDLRRAYLGVDRLRVASEEGFPAAAQIFRGLRPFLGALDPFLDEFNPIFQYLELNQYAVSDFLGGQGSVALSPRISSALEGSPGHYLRQVNPTGIESLAIYPTRLPSNRGNTYIKEVDLAGPKVGIYDIFPNWDCKNAGGEQKADEKQVPQDGDGTAPGCFVTEPLGYGGRATKFPQVRADEDPQGRDTPDSARR